MKKREEQVQGHPLLRGRSITESTVFNHGFSAPQLQSLSAMCEAFIPSLPDMAAHVSSGKEESLCKNIQAFYLASASQAPIPDMVFLLFLFVFVMNFFSMLLFMMKVIQFLLIIRVSSLFTLVLFYDF